jgi:hypothetical protein
MVVERQDARAGDRRHTRIVRVIHSGPIPHAEIERYDDPDIETGLEQCGHNPDEAEYRLIEIEVGEIEDTANFPFDWEPTQMVEALASRTRFRRSRRQG